MSDNRRENTRNKTEKNKEKRIEEKLNELNQKFSKLPESMHKVVDSLIQNAAFMSVTLEELQEEINRNGAVEEYMNGANQYGRKQSAAAQTYNQMIKNYSAVIKQLTSMLPADAESAESEDKLEAFLKMYS